MLFQATLAIFLVSCNNEAGDSNQQSSYITESVQASPFHLEVTAPTEVAAGEEFVSEAIVQYTGDRSIQLEYMGKKILFFLYDQDNNLQYQTSFQEISHTEQVEPHDSSKAEHTFSLDRGVYELVVRTAGLVVDNQPLEGAGNESYISDGMSDARIKEEESRITTAPITIKVN